LADFILSLKKRGLTDKGLELIISDDNAGLAKALEHLFPKTRVQICIAHKMRNVLGKTARKNKRAMADDLKKIYNAGSKEKAMANFKACAKKWYVAEPRAIESLRFSFEKTLTYYEFDKELWTKIRTSNILEREFREVRRRIKVFDSSFNDRDSLMRYGNTIFDYLNNNYPAYLHTKS
jgi:transposase-like protein